MMQKIKSAFLLTSLIFLGSAFSGAYFSDTVAVSGNSYATADNILPACQEISASNYCPAGFDAVSNSVDQNGCPVYSCRSHLSDIIITEIMADPSKTQDSKGEWFEIYNSTDTAINLKNWRYRDNGLNNWTIIQSDLLLQPHSYLVFVSNGNPADNGGIIGGYLLNASFNISNTRDEILIEKPDGNGGYINIDTVAFDRDLSWQIVAGKSIKLNSLTADNSLVENWSLSTTSYGLGDLGTPGGSND